MLYFDTSYLVRLYTRDAGWEKVRALAATGQIGCCQHGQAEAVSALHRKFRERAVNQAEFNALLTEFNRDCKAGAFTWLALSPVVIERVQKVYSGLPATVHLRAAGAIHLACAAENSLGKIYSNDTHLLAAATYFDLTGHNVI